MKKEYNTPSAEKVEFDYSEVVAATSGYNDVIMADKSPYDQYYKCYCNNTYYK